MSAISRMFESGKQVVWAASAAGFVYNSIGLIQSAALKWISHMDASEDQCQDNVWAVVGLATGTALTAGYIYKRFYAAPVDEKDRAGQMSDIFIKSICLLKAKEELSQVNLDEVTTLVKELGAYLQGLPHGKEIMGQVSKIRIPSIDGYVYRTVSQLIQADFSNFELDLEQLTAVTLFICMLCVLYNLSQPPNQGAGNG